MAVGRFSGFQDPSALDRVLLDEMRGLGDEVELVYASKARKATGRMARNVKSRQVGQGINVEVFAKNPIGGFDYVAVTRFGHKVAYIEPRKDRRMAYVVATQRKRGTAHKGNAALRFVIGGRVMYRKRVKGFKPDHDWAEDAVPLVERSAERAMRRVGQRIELLK